MWGFFANFVGYLAAQLMNRQGGQEGGSRSADSQR